MEAKAARLQLVSWAVYWELWLALVRSKGTGQVRIGGSLEWLHGYKQTPSVLKAAAHSPQKTLADGGQESDTVQKIPVLSDAGSIWNHIRSGCQAPFWRPEAQLLYFNLSARSFL